MFKKIISIVTAVSFIFTSSISYADISRRTLFGSLPQAQKNANKTDDVEKNGKIDIYNEPCALTIPCKAGRVMDSFKGTSNSMIIHIQDRHADSTAQLNIANIISSLVDNYGLNMVCLEAASEKIDTSFYDRFPDGTAKENTSRFLVNKGLLTGPEYYKINNKDKRLLAYGVEDKRLYLKHLKLYKEGQPDKEKAVRWLNSLSNIIDNLKLKIYSKELSMLDLNSRAYQMKVKGLDEYLTYLVAEARSKGVDLSALPNAVKFAELSKKEQLIDFDKADKEKEYLVDILAKKLKQKDSAEFMAMSINYKLGKVSDIAFYEYLGGLVNKTETVSVSKIGNLLLYIDYLKLSKEVDHIALFDEIDILKEKIAEALFENKEQRNLYNTSEQIALLKELFTLNLSNKQLIRLNNIEKIIPIKAMLLFIKEQSRAYDIAIDNKILNNNQSSDQIRLAKEYYEIALKRDNAIIDNTLKNIGLANSRTAILVTGGFHTQGIITALKQRGISYVVICPDIGSGNCDKLYNDLMTHKVPYQSSVFELLSQTLGTPLATGDISQSQEAESEIKFIASDGHNIRITMDKFVKHLFTQGFMLSRVPKGHRQALLKFLDENPAIKDEITEELSSLISQMETVDGKLLSILLSISASALERVSIQMILSQNSSSIKELSVDEKNNFIDAIIKHTNLSKDFIEEYITEQTKIHIVTIPKDAQTSSIWFESSYDYFDDKIYLVVEEGGSETVLFDPEKPENIKKLLHEIGAQEYLTDEEICKLEAEAGGNLLLLAAKIKQAVTDRFEEIETLNMDYSISVNGTIRPRDHAMSEFTQLPFEEKLELMADVIRKEDTDVILGESKTPVILSEPKENAMPAGRQEGSQPAKSQSVSKEHKLAQELNELYNELDELRDSMRETEVTENDIKEFNDILDILSRQADQLSIKKLTEYHIKLQSLSKKMEFLGILGIGTIENLLESRLKNVTELKNRREALEELEALTPEQCKKNLKSAEAALMKIGKNPFPSTSDPKRLLREKGLLSALMILYYMKESSAQEEKEISNYNSLSNTLKTIAIESPETYEILRDYISKCLCGKEGNEYFLKEYDKAFQEDISKFDNIAKSTKENRTIHLNELSGEALLYLLRLRNLKNSEHIVAAIVKAMVESPFIIRETADKKVNTAEYDFINRVTDELYFQKKSGIFDIFSPETEKEKFNRQAKDAAMLLKKAGVIFEGGKSPYTYDNEDIIAYNRAILQLGWMEAKLDNIKQNNAELDELRSEIAKIDENILKSIVEFNKIVNGRKELLNKDIKVFIESINNAQLKFEETEDIRQTRQRLEKNTEEIAAKLDAKIEAGIILNKIQQELLQAAGIDSSFDPKLTQEEQDRITELIGDSGVIYEKRLDIQERLTTIEDISNRIIRWFKRKYIEKKDVMPKIEELNSMLLKLASLSPSKCDEIIKELNLQDVKGIDIPAINTIKNRRLKTYPSNHIININYARFMDVVKKLLGADYRARKIDAIPFEVLFSDWVIERNRLAKQEITGKVIYSSFRDSFVKTAERVFKERSFSLESIGKTWGDFGDALDNTGISFNNTYLTSDNSSVTDKVVVNQKEADLYNSYIEQAKKIEEIQNAIKVLETKAEAIGEEYADNIKDLQKSINERLDKTVKEGLSAKQHLALPYQQLVIEEIGIIHKIRANQDKLEEAEHNLNMADDKEKRVLDKLGAFLGEEGAISQERRDKIAADKKALDNEILEMSDNKEKMRELYSKLSSDIERESNNLRSILTLNELYNIMTDFRISAYGAINTKVTDPKLYENIETAISKQREAASRLLKKATMLNKNDELPADIIDDLSAVISLLFVINDTLNLLKDDELTYFRNIEESAKNIEESITVRSSVVDGINNNEKLVIKLEENRIKLQDAIVLIKDLKIEEAKVKSALENLSNVQDDVENNVKNLEKELREIAEKKAAIINDAKIKADQKQLTQKKQENLKNKKLKVLTFPVADKKISYSGEEKLDLNKTLADLRNVLGKDIKSSSTGELLFSGIDNEIVLQNTLGLAQDITKSIIDVRKNIKRYETDLEDMRNAKTPNNDEIEKISKELEDCRILEKNLIKSAEDIERVLSQLVSKQNELSEDAEHGNDIAEAPDQLKEIKLYEGSSNVDSANADALDIKLDNEQPAESDLDIKLYEDDSKVDAAMNALAEKLYSQDIASGLLEPISKRCNSLINIWNELGVEFGDKVKEQYSKLKASQKLACDNIDIAKKLLPLIQRLEEKKIHDLDLTIFIENAGSFLDNFINYMNRVVESNEKHLDKAEQAKKEGIQQDLNKNQQNLQELQNARNLLVELNTLFTSWVHESVQEGIDSLKSLKSMSDNNASEEIISEQYKIVKSEVDNIKELYTSGKIPSDLQSVVSEMLNFWNKLEESVNSHNIEHSSSKPNAPEVWLDVSKNSSNVKEVVSIESVKLDIKEIISPLEKFNDLNTLFSGYIEVGNIDLAKSVSKRAGTLAVEVEKLNKTEEVELALSIYHKNMTALELLEHKIIEKAPLTVPEGFITLEQLAINIEEEFNNIFNSDDNADIAVQFARQLAKLVNNKRISNLLLAKVTTIRDPLTINFDSSEFESVRKEISNRIDYLRSQSGIYEKHNLNIAGIIEKNLQNKGVIINWEDPQNVTLDDFMRWYPEFTLFNNSEICELNAKMHNNRVGRLFDEYSVYDRPIIVDISLLDSESAIEQFSNIVREKFTSSQFKGSRFYRRVILNGNYNKAKALIDKLAPEVRARVEIAHEIVSDKLGIELSEVAQQSDYFVLKQLISEAISKDRDTRGPVLCMLGSELARVFAETYFDAKYEGDKVSQLDIPSWAKQMVISTQQPGVMEGLVTQDGLAYTIEDITSFEIIFANAIRMAQLRLIAYASGHVSGLIEDPLIIGYIINILPAVTSADFQSEYEKLKTAMEKILSQA